jgi:hypothetical protein
LSAPTRTGEEPSPAALPTLDERPSRLSGVRARDTEPAVGALPARSRRAFVLAFGVTLVLLLVLGALLYRVPTPSPEGVTREPPRADRPQAKPSTAPRSAAPEASDVKPRPVQADREQPPSAPHDKENLRTRVKPKRDEGAISTEPAPVDIQLSR